jgi:NAD(P)H-flavin reductase
MNPKAYNSYLSALRSGDKNNFDMSNLDTDDKDMCSFTIKNYKQPTGLSTRFYGGRNPGEEFEVMGPMGKGLSVQSEGIHIAFAGGTGTLTFIDLVAHLILENLGLITTETSYANSNLEKGKSFVTTESVIGE